MKNIIAMLAPYLKDPAPKAKLIADPKAALAERGIKVPAEITIKVLGNTPSVFHLVRSSHSAANELSDDDLASASRGWGCVGKRSIDMP